MELDITKCTLEEIFAVADGKAPCSICEIQNTCANSGACGKYQEWKYQKRREKNNE